MMAHRKVTRGAMRVIRSMAAASIEAFLSVLLLLASVPVLIDPTELAPNSVLRALPLTMVYVWAVGMSLGGTLTLFGIASQRRYVERAGVALIGGVAGVYAIALWGAFGTGGYISVTTYFLFGLAMAARYWQLGNEIKISKGGK